MSKDRDLRTLAADSINPYAALSKARDERDEANALLLKVLNSLSFETKDRLKEMYPELARWMAAAAPSAAPGVEEE